MKFTTLFLSKKEEARFYVFILLQKCKIHAWEIHVSRDLRWTYLIT